MDPNTILGKTEIHFLCGFKGQSPIVYESLLKSFKIETKGLYSFSVEMGIINTDYSFEYLNRVLNANLNGIPTPEEHLSRYVGHTIFAPMYLAFPIEFKYDISSIIFTPSLKLLIETDWITPINRTGDYPLDFQKRLRDLDTTSRENS